MNGVRLQVRGFALAVFLLLMPVIALLTWTFLKVGTASRIQAVQQERNIRVYHTAEAALRRYLAGGVSGKLELNNCTAKVEFPEGKIVARAFAHDGIESVTITLLLDQGFVTERLTDEEN